jgi:hypothetical protein
VPRSWPNGQDEEKRKAFVDLLRILLGDPEIDLWFLSTRQGSREILVLDAVGH